MVGGEKEEAESGAEVEGVGDGVDVVGEGVDGELGLALVAVVVGDAAGDGRISDAVATGVGV